MKILLICSKKDIASINLKTELFSKYSFVKIKDSLYKLKLKAANEIFLREIENLHIFSTQEEILKNEKYNQIIFLSKHSTLSEKKPKCMTVHAIGNWDKAEFGGKNKTVVKTDPILIRSLLLNLKENKNKELKEYEVKQEATHHGPFLDISTIFFEIGSDRKDWENKTLAKYMIEILINTIKEYNLNKIKDREQWISCVGIGGSHYCTKFNRFTFNREKLYCFGHIVPNYVIEKIDSKIINEAKEKSNSEKIITEDDLLNL
jgi:D-aminoacyl-tRNA deacylase